MKAVLQFCGCCDINVHTHYIHIYSYLYGILTYALMIYQCCLHLAAVMVSGPPVTHMIDKIKSHPAI